MCKDKANGTLGEKIIRSGGSKEIQYGGHTEETDLPILAIPLKCKGTLKGIENIKNQFRFCAGQWYYSLEAYHKIMLQLGTEKCTKL